jgi:hypothetical protein
MNWHDTHFARTMGETPLRPDYAQAIERHQAIDRSDKIVLWACALALVALAVLLIWEQLT